MWQQVASNNLNHYLTPFLPHLSPYIGTANRNPNLVPGELLFIVTVIPKLWFSFQTHYLLFHKLFPPAVGNKGISLQVTLTKMSLR